VIYRDDRDRKHFLELLGEMQERFRVKIHAYSLMSNHWHGVLQTPDANLSAAMQWLHLSHASWFNARHNRVGPLWQGRFRDVPIEDGIWAYEVSLYVHLNAVCVDALGLGKRGKKAESAGLRLPSSEEVSRRLKELREYRWSSYRSYGGYEKGAEWLESAVLLARANQDESKQRRSYRQDVKERLSQGVEGLRKERLRDQVAIGSENFVKQVKVLAKGGGRETSGKRELRTRVTFEDVIAAVEEVKGEPWTEFAYKRGDWGRPLVMWAARRYCGLTLREIGERFDGVDYAAVSIALKRFEQAAAGNRRLRKRMKEAAELLIVET